MPHGRSDSGTASSSQRSRAAGDAIGCFLSTGGRGIGTEAQRQLVAYLFATTPVHRLQAGTEVDNIAEHGVLEKVGFRREGVLRGVHFRDSHWRDGVMYGRLRDDRQNRSIASGPKPMLTHRHLRTRHGAGRGFTCSDGDVEACR